MAKTTRIFRISFYNQNTIYELYARHISHDGMLGFVEVGDLVFGANNNMVVDPSEERLKAEFTGVKVTYVPMHAVLRIDEVVEEGVSKIRDLPLKENGNVAQFPANVYNPPRS